MAFYNIADHSPCACVSCGCVALKIFLRLCRAHFSQPLLNVVQPSSFIWHHNAIQKSAKVLLVFASGRLSWLFFIILKSPSSHLAENALIVMKIYVKWDMLNARRLDSIEKTFRRDYSIPAADDWINFTHWLQVSRVNLIVPRKEMWSNEQVAIEFKSNNSSHTKRNRYCVGKMAWWITKMMIVINFVNTLRRHLAAGKCT